MSANFPSLYVSQFANTIELLAQQQESKLQSAVTSGGGHYGKQASPVDQLGLVDPSENTDRFADMPRTDQTVARRWVLPRNWDLNLQYTETDLIRMLNDPKSQMARSAIAGFNRQKDRIILEALGGTNYTGETGTTSTTLPSGQVVGVSTGGTTSNLNVAKIRAAKRILMANDVDVMGEEINLVVNASAYDALLAEAQVVSKDFNEARDGKPVFVDGILSRFLGVNIIHCERVTTGTDDAAGTSASCFMWAKSGAYFGSWKDINVDISQRKDLRDLPWQVYTRMTVGATRLQETKVVRIWARQS